MGTYKYLLIYFCCFSLFYSILDIIVEPYIHSYGSSFFMMMKLKHLKSTPTLAFLLVTLLCGCFAVSITTISIQFVFRYFAMERKGRIAYFRGKYLIIWFLVPMLSATIWIIQDWIFLSPTPQMTEYISETVMINYGTNVSDITYCGTLFYPTDENGVTSLDYKQLYGYLLFCVTMGSTFWIVVIFGFKSYKLVKELPKHGESAYTYKLQNQLFKALVAQAFIPITFLFIPIGLLFTAPLLHFDIEPASFLITIFFSMYPAVDPLPIMLIVADYREGMSGLDILESNTSNDRIHKAFIPITFLFIPIGLLFTAPILHFDIEPASFLVTIFYSMYPAVDPLPIMLIVADYREGMSELFRNITGKRSNNIGSSYTDPQVTSVS